MPTTEIAEAKAQLSALIDKALAGEEVVIGEHGKPLVRLVPFGRDSSPCDLSVRIWESEVRIADDFDAVPEALLEALTVR